ncbi:hypothetical protein DYU11_17490 [Fibrisoma montanum]|uniref:Uncharacterized protein n=1 Tax=Fibrisoma montanum TaxID=2305895 RepID=A0A418M604_9BACT|nr:hypothetical protein [Fibrisoma montanum]RIV21216.1 hypothetical protein DYU11_17490 [Fibrisoma montanum]
MNDLLTIQHISTKRLLNQQGQFIHLYDFFWTERRDLNPLTLRFNFYDLNGEYLETVDMRLPSTRITGGLVHDNGEHVLLYEGSQRIEVEGLSGRVGSYCSLIISSGRLGRKTEQFLKCMFYYEDLTYTGYSTNSI